MLRAMDVPSAHRPWSQPRRVTRVLVVDDNELARSLTAVMLTRRGFSLVEAIDGPAGADDFLTKLFDEVDLIAAVKRPARPRVS